MRTNPKGLHAERWRHLHGCGRFFNAIRQTVSDKFLTTYKAGEPQPDMAGPAHEAER
jgi:sarcosine oxidase, subunit delta